MVWLKNSDFALLGSHKWIAVSRFLWVLIGCWRSYNQQCLKKSQLRVQSKGERFDLLRGIWTFFPVTILEKHMSLPNSKYVWRNAATTSQWEIKREKLSNNFSFNSYHHPMNFREKKFSISSKRKFHVKNRMINVFFSLQALKARNYNY